MSEMDRSQQDIVSQTLNCMLVGLGGTLLVETPASCPKTETSQDIKSTISIVASIANFTARWAADLLQKADILESPIYSVPIEILRRILDYTVENPSLWSGGGANVHCLRCVSARWRQTIDTMPRIWKLSTKMSKHAIQLAVQNSQNLPLSVEFDADDLPYYPSELWDAPPIINRMVAHSDKWGRLFVRTASERIVEEFLRTSAPTLKSLEIHLDYEETQGERIPDGALEHFVTRAPCLRDLVISGWCFGWSKRLELVTDLRSLSLYTMGFMFPSAAPTVDDMGRILSCCPRLQHLEVSGVHLFLQFGTPSPSTKIPLSFLETLNLDMDVTGVCILNTIATPPSTRIQLTGTGTCSEWHILDPLILWVGAVSAQWIRPGSVRLVDDRRKMHVSLNDGSIQFNEVEWGSIDICRPMQSLDPEWRAEVTTVELSHFVGDGRNESKLSASGYVLLLDAMFHGATQFDLYAPDAMDMQKEVLDLLSAKTDIDRDPERVNWVFPNLQGLSMHGPVLASAVLELVTDRLAGMESDKVAQLTRLTVPDAQGDRSRLDELIALIAVE